MSRGEDVASCFRERDDVATVIRRLSAEQGAGTGPDATGGPLRVTWSPAAHSGTP